MLHTYIMRSMQSINGLYVFITHRILLFTIHPHVYTHMHLYPVSRAVINKERDDEQYYILVEGLGLERVMGTPGVDGKNTVTNNIIETQKVLGIEAARCTIASEIKYVLTVYCYAILLCFDYPVHVCIIDVIYIKCILCI